VRWLWDNRQWFFSGAGVTILVSAFYLFRHLFFRASPFRVKAAAASAGRDASVATGSNISQTLNSHNTVINSPSVNLSFPAPYTDMGTHAVIQPAPANLTMGAADPRIYVEIKEPTEAMFPRTPFALRNSGGDVAHRVRIEMLFKLKGQSVSFEPVETIPAGESRESLPTIETGSMMTQHDIFYWLAEDWNQKSEGITEEWPKPLTIRYEDFSGKEFEALMTLAFFPVQFSLSRRHGGEWPRHDYKTWEFRDIKFRRTK
jgi:hypothetical protein